MSDHRNTGQAAPEGRCSLRTTGRHRFCFYSGLAGVLAVATVFWIFSRPNAPLYQNRALYRWLNDLDQGNPRLMQARDAVKALGTNCLPVLVEWIRAHDSRLKIQTCLVIKNYLIPGFSVAPAGQLRARAMQRFSALAEQAAPAVPMLLRVLADDQANDSSEPVAWALAAIGTESVLMLLMSSRDLEMQRAATHTLIKAGAPPEAIPLLIQALGHPDHSVRMAAAEALGQFGPRAQQAIPALTKATNDLMIRVRELATASLEQIIQHGETHPRPVGEQQR